MSKFIEKLEKDKQAKVEKQLAKIRAASDETAGNYRDTGYVRYYNRYNQLLAEEAELEEYLNIDEILKEQLLKVMEEKMELAEMKKALISKVNYLLAVIPECSEAQSFKNYLKSLD